MEVDLGYRPRLTDMAFVGGEHAVEARENLESPHRSRRTSPAETFEGREGFMSDFLGDFEVALPIPTEIIADDVVPVEGRNDGRLDYMHFSVVMSRSRKFARFVAVNMDGGESVRISRGTDKWSLDGRIAADAQWGEELYAANPLDRGHLVRREDPNWGDNAETANEDTFHFTNCAPQMARFNQRVWLGLERYLLDNTRIWKERVSVITGPVFRDDDLEYRGARIPTAFWKIVAFLSDDGKPSATAYMVDQVRELRQLEAAFGAYKTFQRSVRYVEQVTNLDFGPLVQFDGFSNEESASGVQIEAELNLPEQIRV